MLFVEGDLTTDQVGEAAAAHGIVLHELTLQRGSLEQAFMQMTGDSVQYHAHDESTRHDLPDPGPSSRWPPGRRRTTDMSSSPSSGSSSSPPGRRGGA